MKLKNFMYGVEWLGKLVRIQDPELKITRIYAMVKCMTENNIAFRKYLLKGNYDEPFIE